MFIKRVLSGVILVAIALFTILSGGPILILTLLLISLKGFFELTKAVGIHTKEKNVNALEVVGILGSIGYYGVIYFSKGETYVMLPLLLSLVGFMFVYVFSFPKFHATQIMSSFFALIYVPVMLSFIFLTRELDHGIYLVWLIFISSSVSDTFAYLVGMTIGKHKLAPNLSPKKSIEGSIGGIIAAAIAGAIFGMIVASNIETSQNLILSFALIGAVGSMISQIGDLAASAIKRNYEIKDYGHLIPGHGGIVDRFDSVFFTAPLVYFLMRIFVSI